MCILAGGVGSRLGETVSDTPKPLLEVAGKPFIVHQLEMIASQGVREAVICTGYLGDRFEELLGSGDDLGLALSYSHDGETLLGTGGAVRNALPLLGEAFFVMYGDTYLTIDLQDVESTFFGSGLPALLTVLRNSNDWDTSNTQVRKNKCVAYSKTNPTPEMDWIDYGLSVLTAEPVRNLGPGPSDLASLYETLASEGSLGAYAVTERFYEIGTPSSLRETRLHLESIAEARLAGPSSSPDHPEPAV